jgi:hypothetical protein
MSDNGDNLVKSEWQKDKNKRETLYDSGKVGMKTFLAEAMKNEKIRLSVKEGLRESTKNPITKYNIAAGSGFNVYRDDDDPLITGLGGLDSDESSEEDNYTSIFRR